MVFTQKSWGRRFGTGPLPPTTRTARWYRAVFGFTLLWAKGETSVPPIVIV